VSHTDDVFMQHFRNVLIGLVVLFIVILILAFVVSGLGDKPLTADSPKVRAVDKLIAPVGVVNVEGETPAAAAAPTEAPPAKEPTGPEVVQSTCFGCHGTGAAGAPKIGDNIAWEARIGKGIDTLIDNAIKGYNAMPAKGGNKALSDAAVKAAVLDMLAHSGIETGAATEAAPAPAQAPASTARPAAAAEPETAAAAPPAPAPAAKAAAAATSPESAAAEPAAAAPAPAASQFDLAAGENTYKMVCVACHGMGIAGAPKIGDKAGWGPRIAQGMDTLVTHALQGFRGMPPKGGAMTMSDAQVTNAVGYMVEQSK